MPDYKRKDLVIDTAIGIHYEGAITARSMSGHTLLIPLTVFVCEVPSQRISANLEVKSSNWGLLLQYAISDVIL